MKENGAVFDDSPTQGRVLFWRFGDVLIVANSGRPFTKNGLRSICLSSLSSKTEDGSAGDQQFSDSAEAEERLGSIREESKTFALNHPDRAKSVRVGVTAVVRDYTERILLELLQNAADANRALPIGSKGLGFRAILNITDAPRIHSGHLHAKWSREIVRKVLAEAEELPVLDVPEWCPPESESPEVRKLLLEYQTVIVMRLDESGRALLAKEWDTVSRDPSVLVFTDGIESLKWRDEAGEIEWQRKRRGGEVTITPSDKKAPMLWRIVNDDTAAIAFPVNDDGGLREVPPGTDRKLRCFFATGETSPFQRFLVHGDFQLASDRKRIEVASAQTTTAGMSVGAAVARAIAGCATAGAALDLLEVTLADSPDEKAIETVLFRMVRTAVLKQPLPVLAGRSLGEIFCCPKDDDLPVLCRKVVGIETWERLKSALASKRLGGLESLPLLPSDSESFPRNKTLTRYRPSAPISLNVLTSLPWALADGGTTFVDSATFPLFVPPPGSAPALPDGMGARWIDRDFADALREALGNSADSWFEDVLKLHRFRFADFLRLAIVPSLRENAWSPQVRHFIVQFWMSYGASTEPPFDLRDAIRVEFAQRFKVRCRDGSEQVAGNVYAGHEWTNDGFLDREFGGRPFLEPPPEDTEERKKFERFYRWSGVGWTPRVIPILLHPATPRTQQGWLWNGTKFVPLDGAQLPPSWDTYCSDSINGRRAKDMRHRHARLRVNWTLEGGAEMLERDGVATVIEREWASFAPYLSATFFQSGNPQANEDRDDKSGTCESHLLWLLRTTEWVSSTDGKRRPADIFQIGQVTKALEEWLAKPLHSLNPVMARSLRIREKWIEVAKEDWHRWLLAAANRTDLSSDDHNAIRRLYRACLEHAPVAEAEPPPFAEQRVWTVERTTGGETWALRACSKTYFLDQPHLDSLRLNGLWLFPVRLSRLESKAESLFGIKSLQKSLRASVIEANSAYPSVQMNDRLFDRREWLRSYLGLRESDDRRTEIENALSSVRAFVASELRLSFTISGLELGTWPLQRYPLENSESWRLYLTESELSADDRWRWFGEVILFAAGFKTTDKAADVRDILTCREDRLEARLLELNVPPEIISDAKSRHELEKRQPSQEVASSPPGPSPIDDPVRVPRPDVPPPDSPGPILPPSEPPTPGPVQPPGPGPNVRPHPFRGFEAQEWLRKELRQHLDSTWQISETEKDAEDSGRTDIIAIAPDGSELHIEVKRIKGRVIHWSEKQIHNAQAIGHRYCIATVEPTGSEPLVRWIFNPLLQFLPLKRRVRWTWRDDRTDESPDQEWNVSATRTLKPADSYRIEIALTDDFLGRLPSGVGQFPPPKL